MSAEPEPRAVMPPPVMPQPVMPPPVMLVILDGFGWRENPEDNAVAQARKPNFDRLWASCPHAFLTTFGEEVGLPEGQMGNSEVGHLNIGAGRVVMQELPRIGRAIADGSIARTRTMRGLIAELRASWGTCHLMGLVSDGGVHAHIDHCIALARILDNAGVKTVVHAFTDGRDTPPHSGRDFIRRLVDGLPEDVKVATVCGRYYAMDRDHRWDRVERDIAAIVHAEAPRFADPIAVMDNAYALDITDEFVHPAVIGDYRGIKNGDGVLCFNYRADRVRELMAALVEPGFDGFDRGHLPRINVAAGMTQYSDDLAELLGAIFPPQPMTNLLGDVVSAAGRRQLRMAETEKYPHVTYFLNGGREAVLPGEERIMVPSPKVATYDLQPEMSALTLTDRAVEAIGSGVFDLIVMNYANPDMVGHTGLLAAAVRAVETVDAGLGRIAEAIAAQGGALLIIADHGNCEMMRDPVSGEPHTAHTLNPVPAMLVGRHGVALHDGRLADVAPTLLALMGLAQPAEMTGCKLMDTPVEGRSGTEAAAE